MKEWISPISLCIDPGTEADIFSIGPSDFFTRVDDTFLKSSAPVAHACRILDVTIFDKNHANCNGDASD